MQYLEPIDTESPEFGDLYDELPLWSAPFGLMLLDRVEVRRGITILDVGAGTGFLSIELAQRCGADAVVIAVDPWDAAMARLKRKLHHMGIHNVRTVVSSVVDLDLPDASADLIVSNLGINNFQEPEAALRSCFRIAKPGAKLFLATNLAGHMEEFYQAYRSVLLELGFSEQLTALDEHVNHRATVDSVRALLERAGFDFMDAAHCSFRERFADGSSLLRHHFMRLAFMPAWKNLAPPGHIERTFAALEHRLNSIAAERRELSLSIPAACIQACKPGIS